MNAVDEIETYFDTPDCVDTEFVESVMDELSLEIAKVYGTPAKT